MILSVTKSLVVGVGPWLVEAQGKGHDGIYWRVMSEHRTEKAAEKAMERMLRSASTTRQT